MTDDADATGGAPQAADATASSGPMIRVLAQYARDLSFENPDPIGNLTATDTPQIELGIDVRADNPASDDQRIYSVELRLSARATREDKVVFIIELVYAGLFELRNAQGPDLEPMLLIECPRLLFPFARRVIAEITREGGFMPLLIDPVDFLGLYRQQQAARLEQQPEAGA